MTSGALIFALNNRDIDYIRMAVYAAERIDKFLDIPVTLVTDDKSWLFKHYPSNIFENIVEVKAEPYDKRILNDGVMFSKSIDWKNTNRYMAYDLTPYDKTLVIDSDYIINSSTLKSAFSNDHEFQIYRKSFDLSGWRGVNEYERINQYSVPFYWATTFIFVKNTFTESFFNLVNYIRNNWHYFKILYSIESSYPHFRNDYAFSIAVNIMNGKTNGEFAVDLPGKMVYTLDKDVLVNADNNDMTFLIQKQYYPGEYFFAKTSGLDVHVMNKLSLNRFLEGGSGV